jgi:glycosyltransferase involved in cell wall biosynthesis
MAEKVRLKIGIIFNFDPVWMGGIIYIQNLIRILNWLDDDEMPEVTVFYRSDLKKYLDTIEYPYLKPIEWTFPAAIKGYLHSLLKGKNLFIDKILNEHDYLDGIFPVQDAPIRSNSKLKVISWVADLQHKYYPGFFSVRTRFGRNLRIRLRLRNLDDLVVSSEAVANDFKKFYKPRISFNLHVFHFSSVIDDFSHLDFGEIRSKFNLPKEYFMVSNQFHNHKNHEVILKALTRLKQTGTSVHIAMTGRFREASFSPYMQKLHRIIDENDLSGNISLLGLIPRDEQLLLMKHSKAIIQPSLFEGWSTVIEDAISLQIPVVASSLPVNFEQLGETGTFFEPHDDKKLAKILASFPERNMNGNIYEPYDVRVRKAAETFINIFKVD